VVAAHSSQRYPADIVQQNFPIEPTSKGTLPAYCDNKAQADQHVADQISVDEKRLQADCLKLHEGGTRYYPVRPAEKAVTL
jgi:hypothetical protein